jgi:predicted Zn-dependent protease
VKNVQYYCPKYEKKIIKERRRSTNAAPTQASGKDPRRTPNKNRKGHKAEYGQANHYLRISSKKLIRN